MSVCLSLIDSINTRSLQRFKIIATKLRGWFEPRLKIYRVSSDTGGLLFSIDLLHKANYTDAD